ncbi:hypothetical protein PVAG01_04752 [Phlyctema vagabunda]|uniref:Uncharacterized protein n=1 Tax=Phlyctema vagabunda TaxID=108571 RepID=A0ABR4PI81_9HELO
MSEIYFTLTPPAQSSSSPRKVFPSFYETPLHHKASVATLQDTEAEPSLSLERSRTLAHEKELSLHKPSPQKHQHHYVRDLWLVCQRMDCFGLLEKRRRELLERNRETGFVAGERRLRLQMASCPGSL